MDTLNIEVPEKQDISSHKDQVLRSVSVSRLAYQYPVPGNVIDSPITNFGQITKDGEDFATIRMAAFSFPPDKLRANQELMVAGQFAVATQEQLGYPNLSVIKHDSNEKPVAGVLAYHGRIYPKELYDSGTNPKSFSDLADMGYRMPQASTLIPSLNVPIEVVYLSEWESVPGNALASGKAMSEFLNKYKTAYLSDKNKQPIPILTDARIATSGAVLEKHFEAMTQKLKKESGVDFQMVRLGTKTISGEKYQQYMIVPRRSPEQAAQTTAPLPVLEQDDKSTDIQTSEKKMEGHWREKHPGLFYLEQVPEVKALGYTFDPESGKMTVNIESANGIKVQYVLTEYTPLPERPTFTKVQAESFNLILSDGKTVDLLPTDKKIRIDIQGEDKYLGKSNIPKALLSTTGSDGTNYPKLPPDDLRLARASYFFLDSVASKLENKEGEYTQIISTPLVYDTLTLALFKHEQSHTEDDLRSAYDSTNDPTLSKYIDDTQREERFAVNGEIEKMRKIFEELGISVDGKGDSKEFQLVRDISTLGLFGHFLAIYNSGFYVPKEGQPLFDEKFGSATEVQRWRKIQDTIMMARKIA